ncbi:MAG TPA: LPS assembly protein LptD [Pyrinomonadaceae bacterium]|nr:LPS assembly protein LptD [Pyrinomonadaceae bacterium]
MRFTALNILIVLVMLVATVSAQQSNPVERQVANPITDTPNVNPISPEQSIAAPKPKKKQTVEPEGGDGQVVVYSDRQSVSGEAGKRVVTHEGNVDVRYGIYRMQAEKITIYEAETKMDAVGNVIFDQGDDQRITGVRAVWNYNTKNGTFEDSTGFTNQTDDGTIIYFKADKVEKVGPNEILVTNGEFTACDEATPKWSFSAKRAKITLNDKVKLRGVKFRVKGIPLVQSPYASISIRKDDRKSGFLTPSIGYSALKGVKLSGAYFQTLGKSADVTIRGDIFSNRGIGYGMDVRTRANSRSFFDFGFYAVKDRIFGPSASLANPDQGGSTVYAQGVHFFPNGFTASADVRITSNLAFRQVFTDGIQQIISPIEVSQAFINKSWNNYTLNLLARSQVISIPNVRIKTSNLPSVNFEKRPSMISFLKPVYFSFKTSLEGVSRREEVDDRGLYFQQTGSNPTITPALGQRFDIYPQLTLPINTKYFNFTATGSARVTYYSNSFDDVRRVVGRDVIRKYGEFTLDLRPVALARNFYGKKDAFKFRHVIEPFLTYRLVKGVDSFERIIRFDHVDTVANTNEVEFGITNRIYTRKYGEAVTAEAQELLREKPVNEKEGLGVQPYELFTITVRGKYYFDPNFGGSLTPGRRNQIEPMTALSFYTFGGVPRRWSPLNIDATYKPKKDLYVNTRLDIGVNGDGLRAMSTSVAYDTKFAKFAQTFYYTRAVTLMPSLFQYANAEGKEAGTLRGAQWSPSIFLGNRDRGFYGGASLFYDFESRRAANLTPLISSLYTVGYAYDCCALSLQYYRFNLGVRQENRFIFSFRLNGIGTVGTEQFGGLR